MIWTHLFPSVRKTERRRFRFFFLLSGLLVLGQTLGLVGVESLLLTHLGASALPLAFIAASLVTVLLSLLYAFGVDRARNDNYFVRILIGFAILVSAITLATSYLPKIRTFSLLALFCIYYGNFAISTNHFWTFTADFFDSLQSKRLFPLFTVGASFGGLIGGGIAGCVAGRAGGAQLLLWGWILSFVLAAVLLRYHHGALRRWGPLEIEESDQSSMDGMRSSILFLRNSRLGKLLVLSALFMVTSLFVSQYLYSAIFVAAYPEPDQLAKFFGFFLAIANAIELLVELVITPFLLSRFGIANSNLLHPALTLASFLTLGLFPGLGAGIFARLNRETLENSIGGPVRNLLFNALPSRLRGRMRAFLEGIVVYSGMALAGIFLYFWAKMHPATEPGRDLLVMGGFLLAIGFFATNFFLKKDYLEQLLEAIREGRIEPGESGSTLETLSTARLLELWETVSSKQTQSPVLEKLALTLSARGLLSPLERATISSYVPVKLSALKALVEKSTTNSSLYLKRALDDENSKIRLFAIENLPENCDEQLLIRALSDESPEVRAQAAQSFSPPKTEVFQELLDSSQQSSKIAALHRLPSTLSGLAAPFLDSSRPAEVAAALKIFQRHQESISFSRLRTLYKNGDNQVKISALASTPQVFQESGPPVLELLHEALSNSHRSVRQAAVGHFTELGPHAKPILMNTIQATNTAACHGAIEALANIGDPEIHKFFLTESMTRAKRAWSHRLEAARLRESLSDRISERFLTMALDDSADRELTTYFRFLEALEETKVVRSVENVLRFANARIRSDALEVLSNLGNREASSLLIHLLEGGELLERAEALSGRVPPPQSRADLLRDLRESSDPWLKMAAIHAEKPGGQGVVSEDLNFMDRLLMLQSVPLFSAMTLEQLEAIHSCLTEHHYTKGEVLFEEGDIGDEMYIVAEGQVKIFYTLKTSEPLLLTTVDAGSYFGEMSILDRDPRSAAARVSKNSRLFALKGEQLKELIYIMPEIAFTIFRVLSDRVRRSDKRLENLSKKQSQKA